MNFHEVWSDRMGQGSPRESGFLVGAPIPRFGDLRTAVVEGMLWLRARNGRSYLSHGK